MHQFDRRCADDGFVTCRPEPFCGIDRSERERWPDSFAARCDQVPRDVTEQRVGTRDAAAQRILNPLQIARKWSEPEFGDVHWEVEPNCADCAPAPSGENLASRDSVILPGYGGMTVLTKPNDRLGTKRGRKVS